MTIATHIEDSETVTIESVGNRGDGIAHIGDTPVYIPYTLPAETIRMHADGDRGIADEILAPSPERVTPICRHFGHCGGCALQHWQNEGYTRWKESRIAEALAARGLRSPIAPIQISPLGIRRRASFSARRHKSGVLFGFQSRASHEIVPLTQCDVLHPQLVETIPALTELIAPLLSRRATAHLNTTLTESGLDVSIKGTHDPGADEKSRLSEMARSCGIARLTIGGEIIAQFQPPVVRFDGIAVRPPPDAFLQTSKWADQNMVERVRAALINAHLIADLFAGCGTFSLPLARNTAVHAVDSNSDMLAALRSAARNHQGLKPVQAEVRNLFAQPLTSAELEPFDAVIFDPPRAGARAQAEQLATAKVPTIIAVSCNPATFARDARILAGGGYRLQKIWPIDQFLYSAHIELIAALEREA